MDDSSYERLRIERRDHGVMLLTLSNPGKLNATDAVLHAELARVFHDVHHDPSVRAVVVTGEGGPMAACIVLFVPHLCSCGEVVV